MSKIIIDGIDVSKCKYCVEGCIINDGYDICEEQGKECYKVKDCYYKQFQRLKAENEALRFPTKDNNYAVMTKEEFDKYNKLKANYEELENTSIEIIRDLKNNLKLAEQLINKTLEQFNLTVFDWQDDQNEITTELQFFIDEHNKLKQKLEKIKEIVIPINQNTCFGMHCGTVGEITQ